jgi:hypothetical protein
MYILLTQRVIAAHNVAHNVAHVLIPLNLLQI